MVKAFDDSGLTALAAYMKTTKKAADANSSAVSELEGDFQELVQQMADCMTELDAVKADLVGFGVLEATVE